MIKQLLTKTRIAIVAILLLLSGCSSQFAYNNLDWLVYWYIDDFVELDRGQKKEFDVYIEDWLRWHRGEELNKYVAHLQRIRAYIDQGEVSAEIIKTELESGRSHWLRLREQLTPGLVEFALRLNQEQVDSLFDELEDQNQEREEDLAERSEAERKEKLEDNLNDRIRDYIGKLSSSQKQIIASYVPLFRSNTADWLDYRRLIQTKAKALFQQDLEPEAFQQQLQSLMLNPEQYRTQVFVENMEYNRETYAALISELSATLSAKQKARLLRELDGLIEDLQELSEDQ